MSDLDKELFGDDYSIMSADIMESIADAAENERTGDADLNTEDV